MIFYSVTPGPPSTPEVTKITKNSMTVVWSRPTVDGGSEISGYFLEKLQTVDRLSAPELDIDANFKQTHIVRAGASIRLFIAFSGRPVPTAVWSKADANLSLRADIQTTDSFSTLTVEECNRNDAGKYVFTVENNSGSKSITFTVKVLDTPGPPGPITFKDVTRTSITLMWDAPVLDGGSRIHHYVVEKREASRRSWQVVSSKCTRQIFKVTDLAEGMPYYYRVSAENEYGVGEPCELTEPVVATEEPAPPKRLDIVDTTKSSVVLAWLKPDHDGGSRITGYLLEMRQKGSDSWTGAGQTKQLTFTVEGLVENTEYEFRVKAKNDAGYSEPREAFSSVIVKEPQIEPTADLSDISRQLITCKAGSTFTIDIPISGRPAPKVTWKLEEMRLKETERVTIKTTKDRTTLTVKDSMRGDSGKYYLTLENTAGVKTFTVTVVVIGRPGPVTGPIEISSVSAESCVLTWKEPEDDGGSDITNYIVEKRESGTTAWQLVNSSVKRTQIKVSHLTKYQEYSFRVSSENRFGVSKPVESKTLLTFSSPPFSCLVPPSPPSRPEVYSVSASAMAIRWEEPYHDGGSKVIGYWVEKKERNTILWTFYRVTGLLEGALYYFRVLPENIYGIGEGCETSDAVLVSDVPMVPQKLEVIDTTKSTVTLAWEKPLHDGGSRLTGYVIEASKAGTERWLKVVTLKPTVFEHTIISLNEGEQYLFRVRAQNQKGVSEPREIVTAVTVQDRKGRYLLLKTIGSSLHQKNVIGTKQVFKISIIWFS
uniref:Titin n=1 Tax=Zonotrichia albicollis TaxID=44394 RepID=A0A8D2QKP8_ZONAL